MCSETCDFLQCAPKLTINCLLILFDLSIVTKNQAFNTKCDIYRTINLLRVLIHQTSRTPMAAFVSQNSDYFVDFLTNCAWHFMLTSIQVKHRFNGSDNRLLTVTASTRICNTMTSTHYELINRSTPLNADLS